MPSVSKRQQQFMGAELARKRAGKKTKTQMSEKQLEEFASTKRKGLPARKGKETGIVNMGPGKPAPKGHHMMPGQKMPMKDSEMMKGKAKTKAKPSSKAKKKR